mmetsp:Transcript_6396/g.15148  ORF Transcript_6396/g.15148 Transcript_6396/m.15148 type:complete len:297 (+) Transcript_6396:2635-3525(+)
MAVHAVLHQLQRVFKMKGLDGERAPRERHARRPLEVVAEDGAVHRCGHHAHREARAIALDESLEGHQEEVALDRALVHLVDEHVRDPHEGRVLLQPPQQHPSGAEEQAGLRARLRLPPDRVPDDPLANLLPPLGRHALCNAYRRDAPRLRADDVNRRVGLGSFLQKVLRYLRRLAAPRLALHEARRLPQRRQHLLTVLEHRQPVPHLGERPPARDGRGGGRGDVRVRWARGARGGGGVGGGGGGGGGEEVFGAVERVRDDFGDEGVDVYVVRCRQPRLAFDLEAIGGVPEDLRFVA